MNTIISQMLDTCVNELHNQKVPEYIRAKAYPYVILVCAWSFITTVLLLIMTWNLCRLQLST